MTDPFAQPSEVSSVKVEKKFGNVYNGRYHMASIEDPNAWLPGGAERHVPRGVMRTSNLSGALSDTRALALWEQRRGLDGLRTSIRLQEELSVLRDPTDDQLNAFFEKAKEEGGGSEAARRGTARHDMLEEYLTTGREMGTAGMRLQMGIIKETLREHLFVPVPELTERIVYNDEVKCAGRWDGVLRDLQTRELHIDDLKTKRRQFWTMLEVRTQLAIYARGTAMWDAGKGCYVGMPPLNIQEAYVLHVPVDGDENGKPVCHVLRADIEKGWGSALLARQVVDLRSEAKRVGTLRDAVRPHPGVTLVELYAGRFRSVASAQEGGALVAECLRLGVWCPELEVTARDAVERIMAPKDLEITS